MIGNSNALEALAADYSLTTGGVASVKGAVAAFRTVDAVYAHEYAICSRFKQGHLEYVTPLTVTLGANSVPVTVTTGTGGGPAAYFWGARMHDNEIDRSDTALFAVYVSPDERTFTVDSQWLSDSYPITNTGYILTFQVWAPDPATTGALTKEILQDLADRGTLHYRNTPAPTGTTGFRQRGHLHGRRTPAVYDQFQPDHTYGGLHGRDLERSYTRDRRHQLLHALGTPWRQRGAVTPAGQAGRRGIRLGQHRFHR